MSHLEGAEFFYLFAGMGVAFVGLGFLLFGPQMLALWLAAQLERDKRRAAREQHPLKGAD